MCSSDREGVAVAFKALDAALVTVLELDFEALSTPERFAVLERCEQVRRRLPAVEHRLVNQIRQQASPVEVSGKLHWALADRLLITRADAKHRVEAAMQLGSRRTLTGAPLEPVCPATAAGQRAGVFGAAAAQVICDFVDQLPAGVNAQAVRIAEARLADYAEEHRPEHVRQLAAELFDYLVPDGERARRRGLVIGPQDHTGMSSIKGWLDPPARATLDAVLAKLAAPGMCNPDDETPCVAGTPSQDAIDADTRSAGQRNHDALTAMGRALLATGDLGQHNGLPATIVVSTTLTELEARTGKARTGGGSWLPMRDVIRLATHAHHYLRIFDKSHGVKEVALFHTRRIASPGQRIVLHARDRGCSHPGCSVPGYLCEAHHVTDYARKPETTITNLTFACGPHHRLIKPDGWTTRKHPNGTTEWLPPPHLDHGQPRTNQTHHPEQLLQDNDDDGVP